MNTAESNAAPQPQRAIPPLPGGGSWTFDEAAWAWVSNDPAPAAAPAEPAAAEAAPAPTAAPAAEQAATEE